jgi:hypothetical protein
MDNDLTQAAQPPSKYSSFASPFSTPAIWYSQALSFPAHSDTTGVFHFAANWGIGLTVFPISFLEKEIPANPTPAIY